MVGAVTREWFQLLRRTQDDYESAELDDLIATFFTIFYVDDAYLASRDVEYLQRALDVLVSRFKWLGLLTNNKHEEEEDPGDDLHPRLDPNSAPIRLLPPNDVRPCLPRRMEHTTG